MLLKLTKNLLKQVLVKQEMTLDSSLKKIPSLLIHWSNLSLNGKKSSPENHQKVCEEADNIGNEFPCGEVHVRIEKELSVTYHHTQF